LTFIDRGEPLFLRWDPVNSCQHSYIAL